MMNYHSVLISLSTLSLFLNHVSSQTDVCVRVPRKTTDCLMSHKYNPVPRDSVTASCLQELIWEYSSPQNLTEADEVYFKRLSGMFLDGPSQPLTGFRQRKEYRQLTTIERGKVHRAFQILYDEGTIHRYGKLYGKAYPVVRHSPAFLSFNRVFLTFFEEELRRIDDSISLPYWDYTVDYLIDNPANSLVWSEIFFGNGNGRLSTGDFRGWMSPKGPVQRRYGESNYAQLMSRSDVAKIISRCNTADVTYPVRKEEDEVYVIEYYHNGAVNWVGGSSADAMTAAYDPVFYMLSAFSDHVWEVFRKVQGTTCNVNPSMDYPDKSDGTRRNALEKMFGFSEMANQHGFSNYWTTYWYNYTLTSTCPDCNSEYVWCDRSINRCVGHSRRTDYNSGGYSAPHNEAYEPYTEYIPHRIDLPALPSPFNDGRTMATVKRDAKQAMSKHTAKTAGERQFMVLNAISQTTD